MNVTVLAATGATGSELTRQALIRGHTVTAIARHPERIEAPGSDRLRRIRADVHDPDSLTDAIGHDAVVLSGLGVTHGDRPGTLTAGARSIIAAHPARIIWLGAFGTGASAVAAGFATRTLLKAVMGSELHDKVTADTAILDAGGTVFHPGPLSNGPLSATRRTLGIDAIPRRLLPARISRATVAAAMLDETEVPHFTATTAIPLSQ
jgi:uncharacterized protein